MLLASALNRISARFVPADITRVSGSGSPSIDDTHEVNRMSIPLAPEDWRSAYPFVFTPMRHPERVK